MTADPTPPPFGATYQGRRPKYQGVEEPLANYRIDAEGHVWKRAPDGSGWLKYERITFHSGPASPWNPPGARTIPAPEPFPPGPLHWTATRLDQVKPC